VVDAHAQRVRLSTCEHPISLESMASRKLSALLTHVQHSAIGPDGTLREGSNRIQQSDADLDLPSTSSSRCIPGNVSPSAENVDIAHAVVIAANALGAAACPCPAVSNRSNASARQSMPAIHLIPLKSAEPSKPLLSASLGFLDVAERSMSLSANMSQESAGNVFPYGQCTWWANQRYYQLHGSYVPWKTNANAFQWVDRAIEYGWHVSSVPIVSSIIVLQPYVEGAYGVGHVGVVEQILTDGNVVVSSMNWGSQPNTVTDNTFVLGPGVSFIYPTNG